MFIKAKDALKMSPAPLFQDRVTGFAATKFSARFPEVSGAFLTPASPVQPNVRNSADGLWRLQQKLIFRAAGINSFAIVTQHDIVNPAAPGKLILGRRDRW